MLLFWMAWQKIIRHFHVTCQRVLCCIVYNVFVNRVWLYSLFLYVICVISVIKNFRDYVVCCFLVPTLNKTFCLWLLTDNSQSTRVHPPVFSGVHVTRFVILCVCLPLWYLQTLLCEICWNTFLPTSKIVGRCILLLPSNRVGDPKRLNIIFD